MTDPARRQLPKALTKNRKFDRAPFSSAARDAAGPELSQAFPAAHATAAGYPFDGVPRLIALERVCYLLCLKDSAVHAKVATGELPAPVKFGTSRRAAARWLEHEIVAFILAKAAARGEISPVASPKRGSQ